MHQSALKIQYKYEIYKPYSQKLWKKLGKVVSQLKELQNGCDSWKVQENAGVLPISLLSVQGEMDQLLEEPPTQEVTDGILDFYFTVRDFLNISDWWMKIM